MSSQISYRPRKHVIPNFLFTLLLSVMLHSQDQVVIVDPRWWSPLGPFGCNVDSSIDRNTRIFVFGHYNLQSWDTSLVSLVQPPILWNGMNLFDDIMSQHNFTKQCICLMWVLLLLGARTMILGVIQNANVPSRATIIVVVVVVVLSFSIGRVERALLWSAVQCKRNACKTRV